MPYATQIQQQDLVTHIKSSKINQPAVAIWHTAQNIILMLNAEIYNSTFSSSAIKSAAHMRDSTGLLCLFTGKIDEDKD